MLPALRVNIGHHIASKDGDFPDMAIGVSCNAEIFTVSGEIMGDFVPPILQARRNVVLQEAPLAATAWPQFLWQPLWLNNESTPVKSSLFPRCSSLFSP